MKFLMGYLYVAGLTMLAWTAWQVVRLVWTLLDRADALFWQVVR